MGNKNSSQDVLFYNTWVVERPYGLSKIKNKYSFPDFKIGYYTILDKKMSEKERVLCLQRDLFELMASEIKQDRLLNKPMSEDEIKERYGDNCKRSKIRINIWDVLNETHPPKKPLALPSPQQVLLLNNKNISEPKASLLDLNFWVAIYDDCSDYQEDVSKEIEFKQIKPRYQIQFPEINEDCSFVIDALTEDELLEKIDDRLIQSIKEYITRCAALPDKCSEEAARKKSLGADDFKSVSITLDDYLEILNQTNPYRTHQPNMYRRNYRPL